MGHERGEVGAEGLVRWGVFSCVMGHRGVSDGLGMGSGLGGGWRKCRAVTTPQHPVRAILGLGANGSTRVDGLLRGGCGDVEKGLQRRVPVGGEVGVRGEVFWRVSLVAGWKSLPMVLEKYLPIGGFWSGVCLGWVGVMGEGEVCCVGMCWRGGL